MASAVRTRRAAHRLVTKASVLQEVDENAQEPEEHEREQQLGDFLEEMDMEVDMRCRSMYALADQVALTMRNRLRVEIMKIPRNIRSMTAKDFEKEFGCSIEDVLTNPDAAAAAATSTAATATVRKPSKRPPTRAPATTAKRARGAATAGTSGVAATPAGRRPRRGDQPPATVVKTRSGKEVSVFQRAVPTTECQESSDVAQSSSLVASMSSDGSSSGVRLNVEGAGLVDLGNKQVMAAMSTEGRAAILEQMRAMQSTVSAIMSELEGGGTA